jgi:hypothetical protein
MNMTELMHLKDVAFTLKAEQKRQLNAVVFLREYPFSQIVLESLEDRGLVTLDDSTAVATGAGRHVASLILTIGRH